MFWAAILVSNTLGTSMGDLTKPISKGGLALVLAVLFGLLTWAQIQQRRKAPPLRQPTAPLQF